MKHVLIIVNPVAGGFSEFDLERVKGTFHRQGVSVSIYRTEKAGDGTVRARKTGREFDAVIAMGGDGTVNEVVNGLACSNTPLGIIPTGTENVLAQDLNIPSNPLKAARIILKENQRRVDLGKVDGHYFAFVAGVGFDAHVAARTDPLLKKLLGKAAYPLTAFREILTYDPGTITIKADGEEHEGTFVIIGNSRLYGGAISFTPDAEMDDGVLDFCVMKNTDLFSALRYALAARLRRIDTFPDVVQFRTKKATITADKPLLVHTDAEIIGETPVDVEIKESCLGVLIP